MLLDEGGWYSKNRIALEAHLERWRERAAGGERLTATFDFDNTTIFHDVGEATMRYQLEQLAFRMTVSELATVLPEEVNGVRELTGGVSLAAARSDLLESYEELTRALDEGGLERARALPTYRDFAARMAWLYNALEEEPALGAGVAYPFLARWVGGFTQDGARDLARQAVAMASAERPTRLSWKSDEARRSGPVVARFHRGLNAYPEIRNLMRALTTIGVEVYIISASQQLLVQGAAEALGYPVPSKRIFGMRLEREGERVLPVPVDTKDYPLTWRGGKREIIERFLPTPPVLAAGDSDTDFEMLTSFKETEVRLIINRDLPGDIRSLYDDERTLLQGRDEGEGRFCAARESVKLDDGERESGERDEGGR